MNRRFTIYILLALLVLACKKDEQSAPLNLNKVYFDSQEIDPDGNTILDVGVSPIIRLVFSESLDESSLNESIQLSAEGELVPVNISLSSDDKVVNITPADQLAYFTPYVLTVSSELTSENGSEFDGTDIQFTTIQGTLVLESMLINENDVTHAGFIQDVPLTLDITMRYSESVDRSSLESAIKVTGDIAPELSFTYSDNDQVITISTQSPLSYYRSYDLTISDQLEGADGANFSGYATQLFTTLDETNKFPPLSDEELLTLVQRQTFRYFWDFAHPVSGLSRERNTSGHTVASGASGFGLMTIPVAIKRGFITHTEGVERLTTMIHFLGDKADRFHGAWSHWLHGETGAAIAFSEKDNGGDLVETSFVAMGLVTVRQYLDAMVAEEKALIDKINTILEDIEWDWYQQNNQDVLYWHWSPDYAWEMNHPIRGWNEALITYVMAASSATHGITKEVYNQGWKAGKFVNGKSFYDITLPLGPDYGGPLFFEQYTFLGLDPRNLSGNQGESYWEQVVNHTLINREHCVRNPNKHIGYSASCWGLTASDGYNGYSAHSPTNDRGVITPTAALSSLPFTPDQSMEAMKHFYYAMGDRLWGPYGFYDAFSVKDEWYATSNIGIDQGPIILMIENHRSGLLWDLFMSAPEVQNGLNTLGFTY
ncbi:glucoamylase family protein [Carboxylicivirga sp. RSCT41]|uniref:glucoamylase family protein n=1 Tax=Carboxylicivirga agarovorans TaxID=3417570 RepID=UPI003D3591C5